MPLTARPNKSGKRTGRACVRKGVRSARVAPLVAQVLATGFIAFGFDAGCHDLGSSVSGGPVVAAGAAGTTQPLAEAGAGEGGNLGTTSLGGDSGAAGESATAGTAGGIAGTTGGIAGTASLPPSDGGGADGGAKSADTNGVGEVVTPACISYGYSQPPVAFATPRALAVSLVGDGHPYVLYATVPETQIATLRWKTATDDYASWTAWLCFDLVRHPAQIAATNLLGNAPELFATTDTGSLYVRRMYASQGSWGVWEPMNLPHSNSQALDVATSTNPDRLGFVYILDDGALFVRRHLGNSPTANFSAWAAVQGTPLGARHLCAGNQADTRQQAFVATSNGKVFTTTQQGIAPDSKFGPFQELSDPTTPPMSDIDCGYVADALTVFGLSSGVVWSRASSASGVWGPWVQDATSSAPVLKTLAIGSRSGQAATVFGTDSSNVVWWHLVGSTVWQSID